MRHNETYFSENTSMFVRNPNVQTYFSVKMFADIRQSDIQRVCEELHLLPNTTSWTSPALLSLQIQEASV